MPGVKNEEVLVVLALTMILCGGVNVAAQGADPAEVIMEAQIVGVKNYMTEHCIKVSSGQSIEYEFESPTPLNFNVHYHTESETFFATRKDDVTALSETLYVDSDQDYCFTWTNLAESGVRWTIYTKLNITN